MIVRFIVPCRNIEKNVPKLLSSLLEQTSDNWRCVIIDDMSDDDTQMTILNYLTENSIDSKISFHHNYVRKHALKNVIELSRPHQDSNDVIAVIDGDDQLCNPNTVKLLLDAYSAGNDIVWTAHKWDINGMNISKSMPANVNPYQWPWSTSHLRTFRASLLKDVSDENFKDSKGEWFKRGYDQALMLPLLSLTTKRKYINDVCYLYNINSVSMPKRDWTEVDQLQTINFVRARGFVK